MLASDCIFCKIIAHEIPAYVLYEDEQCLAFLDIAPFERGHALVIPKQHAQYLTDLPDAVVSDLMPVIKRVARMLLSRLPCDGFNILQNNGSCATQVVPHVHFHVVPRWNGRAINWSSGAYQDPDELVALHQRLIGQ